eukprot:TRINITY_DN8528_c0_g1_i1.p1 TRINITY_DN8528_c0_g1~~TRINITY_DN8528_c0_g1_i1.p1  ORF type:complete len:533 (-),score=51.04 TRINITY_DN8528_c0_g1_i1:121-1575(-)
MQSCFKSCCAPSDLEVRASFAESAGDSEVTPRGIGNSRFLFYLHEDGAFNFQKATRCYMEAVGIDHIRDIDQTVNPGVAEHMGDLSFLQSLRDHPQRTLDVREASLHIIGSPIYVSYQAATFQQCGGEEAHVRRMRAMKDQLLQTEAFKEHTGRNFLIHVSSYEISNICKTSGFYELLERGNVIVATSDRSFGSDNMRKVITAYRADYSVDVKASTASQRVEEAREITFMFHGNQHRSGSGMLRFELLQGLQMNAEVVNTSFVDFKYTSSGKNNSKQVSATYDTYLRSNFCVILPGDSTTSRRLFDAMAAGCIPVIFAEQDLVSKNLPFRKSIDWAHSVVFAGGIECNVYNYKLAGSSLGCLLDTLHTNKSYIETFRARMQATFTKHLSYASGHGLVSSLLCEVDNTCSYAGRVAQGLGSDAQITAVLESYRSRNSRCGAWIVNLQMNLIYSFRRPAGYIYTAIALVCVILLSSCVHSSLKRPS